MSSNNSLDISDLFETDDDDDASVDSLCGLWTEISSALDPAILPPLPKRVESIGCTFVWYKVYILWINYSLDAICCLHYLQPPKGQY
jgi:hypothetical protein